MGANNNSSPLVQRRRLRAELRRARQDAGQTQEQVAAALDWSRSKIIRIETGAVNISTDDLKALLSFYDTVDPGRADELIGIAATKPPNRGTARSKTRSGACYQHSEYSSAPAKKGMRDEVFRQQLSTDEREALGDGEKTERQCQKVGRGVIRPVIQLPESRSATAPQSLWDFYERREIWETTDDDSLRRNIRWRWHQAAQRLVSLAGVSALILAFLDLVKLEGLPPQMAAHLTLACLLGGSGGYVLREVVTTLVGKRHSGKRKVGDDSPS